MATCPPPSEVEPNSLQLSAAFMPLTLQSCGPAFEQPYLHKHRVFYWRGRRSPSQGLFIRGLLVDLRDAMLGQRLNCTTLNHVFSENIDFQMKMSPGDYHPDTESAGRASVSPVFGRSAPNRRFFWVPGVIVTESTKLFISVDYLSALSRFIIKGQLILH